jgi:Zn-dependent protease with chaperone function
LTTSSATPGRSNPFAFPSNVDFAFGLLVAVVLGTSLLIYLAIANTVESGFESQAQQNARCEALAGPLSQSDTLQDRERWLSAFSACQNGRGRPVGGVVAGLAALSIGAAGIYALSPAWKIRRARLVPVTAGETPELLEELRGLRLVAGVDHEPTFVWNPLNMACSGLAFGLPGRRFVAISGGLATKLWTDPGVFRAVVLHELAHLRNGDVDKTYATVAVWWSFVATALLPFALVIPWSDLSIVPRRVLSLTALALVVYLLRGAALRARETYADVRASTWSPFADGLDRALPSGPPEAPGWRSPLSQVRHWFSLHPLPSVRRHAVRDPTPLFATSFWFAAGTGVAGSLSLVGAVAVVDILVPGAGDWAAAVVFAGLVVGVAGLALWRAVFLAEVRDVPMRGLWRVAFGLAAGLAVGDLLSLSATASVPDGFALTGAPLLIFDLVWYGLLLVGTTLFLRWVAACASTWLPAVATRESPRLAFSLGAVPAVLVLAVGLEFLFYIAATRTTGGILPASIVAEALSGQAGFPLPAGPYFDAALALTLLVLQVAASPFFYTAAQLLWLVPLAAWLYRRRAAPVATARWALLDPIQALPPHSVAPPLRPGLCVVVGFLGGILFGLVSVPVSLGLQAVSSGGLSVWLLYGQSALGVFLQTIVAFVLALSVRRVGAIHGLFGAFICGCVVAIVALADTLLTVGLAGLQVRGLVAATLTTYLNVAALITVPASAGAAGVATWIRWIGGERLRFRSLPRGAPR